MAEILAIDPGWSTGWAFLEIGEGRALPPKIRVAAQGTTTGGVDGWLLEGLEVDWPDRLVGEDFIVDPSYVGRAWSSEVIGAVKARRVRSDVVLQLRSDKTTLFTQKHTGDKGETERFAWLRERGFSGTPHELDAITHALVYLKRQRNRAALKQYWGI